VVISGHFKDRESLKKRSSELVVECNVRLVGLEAETLGEMVSILAEHPAYRQAINWRSVFSSDVVSIKAFKKQIKGIQKDRIIKH
jgi:hypothetical protein